MKNLADLIIELQQIPNPEKIGIVWHDERFYRPLEVETDMAVLHPLSIFLHPEYRQEAQNQGIEQLLRL